MRSVKYEYLQTLKNLYPNLYRQLKFIDCRDGWLPLINRLSAKIEEILIDMPEPDRAWYYVVRIKQKFGILRFCMSRYPSDQVYELIREAETESKTICERCGAPGTLYTEASWEVICDRCIMRRAIKYGWVRNRLEALVKYNTHCSEEEWEQLKKETEDGNKFDF